MIRKMPRQAPPLWPVGDGESAKGLVMIWERTLAGQAELKTHAECEPNFVLGGPGPLDSLSLEKAPGTTERARKCGRPRESTTLSTQSRSSRGADRRRRSDCRSPDRSSRPSRSPTSRRRAVGSHRGRAPCNSLDTAPESSPRRELVEAGACAARTTRRSAPSARAAARKRRAGSDTSRPRTPPRQERLEDRLILVVAARRAEGHERASPLKTMLGVSV